VVRTADKGGTRPWSKRISAIIAAGGAAVALTMALSGAPSSATTAKTWTVKPGGKATVSGSLQFRDTKTTAVTPCRSVKLDASLKGGSGLDGQSIGSITSATFAGCALGSVVISLTVAVHGLPWKLNAVNYTAKTGVTTGTITGIDLVANGVGFTMTLDGTKAGADNGMIRFAYTNATGKLKLLPTDGDLHTWEVAGGLGLVDNGDPQDPSGSLTVTPKQTITSP
jgi:hypothetical protein